MPRNIVQRFITAVFDRDAAKKVEGQFADSMSAAGAKAGAGFLKEMRAQFDKRMADLKVSLARGLISPEEFKKQGAEAAKQFNAGVIKGMDQAKAAGTITNAEYLKLARTLKTAGEVGGSIGDKISAGFRRAATAVVGFFAVGAIKDAIFGSIQSAVDQEKSVGQLASALDNLGISYSRVKDQAEGYFDRIQQTTRFSNTDARQALANLITITGSYDKSLALLNLTADIAAKRGTTMTEQSEAAGKASLGFAKGLQDLGINSRETSDLVKKLNESVGGFATREGRQAGAQLITLHNLLDDVKTSFGDALVGSDGFRNGTGQLKQALIDLNVWVKANKDDIEGAATNTVKLLGALGKLGVFLFSTPWIKRTGPGFLGLGDKVFGPTKPTVQGRADFANKLFDQFDEEDSAVKGGKRPRALTKAEQDALDERERLEKERAKRIADELKRIRQESAANQLMIEEQLTESLAKELARRAALLAEAKGGEGDELRKGFAKLDQQQLLLRAGLDQLTPKMMDKGTGFQGGTETHGLTVLPAPNLAPNKKAAHEFESVWVKALRSIEEEVGGQGTLFAELGQAWAEGGLKGLAELAAGKVKQNIAEAIEWGAKALGFLALGQPHNAATAGASAAEHAAAAAAWELVAGGLGGSGGGGGSGASAGSSGGSPAAASTSSEPAVPDIHVYFEGPGFDALNPVVRRVVLGSLEQQRQIQGNNVKVTVHRKP